MLRLALMVCCAASLAACGGGGKTPNGPGPDVLETSALLDSVEAGLAAIAATDPDARLTEIVRYLSARPEFVASGVAQSTGSAWARTADGRAFCFVDQMLTPEMEPKGAGKRPSADRATRWSADPAARALPDSRIGLPGGTFGYVSTVFQTEQYFDRTTGGVWSELTSDEYGFSYKELHRDDGSTGTFANASVERLAAVQDVGVFHMNTVVGAFKQPDDTELVALMTATEVTPSSEATYRSLLQDGLLVIMSAPPVQINEVSEGPRLRRFGITAKFIRTKMRLASDALVYLDAGYGNHPDLKAAFAAVGADVYLSWEKMPCDASLKDKTVLFVFDHLLPGSGLAATQMWPGSNSRPFDYQQVYAALRARGLGWDRCGNLVPDAAQDPHLALTEGDGNLAFITPSIRYLVVDEAPDDPMPDKALLRIYGSFGPDPGPGNRSVQLSISIGGAAGAEQEIISWTPAEITCWIPSRPQEGASCGRVYVHRRGIASNGVPLTEWLVPVTVFDRDPNTTFWVRADLTLHLRLDIHGWRDVLNQPYPLPTAPEPLYEGGISAGRYSTGSWSCGGFVTNDDINDSICGTEDLFVCRQWREDSWYAQSGSGSLPYRSDQVEGMYAWVVAYHDPVTLAQPNPPATIRVDLRFMGPGRTLSVGSIGQTEPQYTESSTVGGTYTFDLEVDPDETDGAGEKTYPIKAGARGTVSWPKTYPSMYGVPAEYTEH